MAITKVLHMSADFDNLIGSHLDNAIEYILQDKKLGPLHLCGGINCMTSGTYEQMLDTKKMFGKTGGRQGYHFIISLKPGEGTPQEMYEIAMKFAEKAFHNEYESVVAVHTDKDHLHAHVIINSVNMLNGKKFQYKKGDWKYVYQPITNELCEEYGFSILPAEYSVEPTNVPKNEYLRKMKFNDFIREDCESLLSISEDTAHFIWLLKRLGYEVKEGVHIAVKLPGMKRFARLDTIDRRYARDVLDQTIVEANYRGIRFPVRTFNTDRYNQGQTAYQKRYYYQIRGLRVTEKYRFGYKAARYYKDIMLLQKLQEEYLFLCDNHIHSFDDLLDYRSNAVDELDKIHDEQQEIYKRNAILKRKCDTPEGLREYQAEHMKNGQRLDELKKRARELRKGKSLAERQMASSINEALERIGQLLPEESLEIDPSISDVPEYPVAVARLKAEKERREAEKVERQRAEKEKIEAERIARQKAEQERIKAERIVKQREEQARKDRFIELYSKMQTEGKRLVDEAYAFPFNQPYKWDYIRYIDDRRFVPISSLTEKEMAEPFLTYEQFVEQKEKDKNEWLAKHQNEMTTEKTREKDSNSSELRREDLSCEDNVIVETEQPNSVIFHTEESKPIIFHTKKPASLLKRDFASAVNRDSVILETDARKTEKKTTVTKQDYVQMTDKERAEWIGISMDDMPSSIKRFKNKMEQIGIWRIDTPEMTDAFFKLWNQLEKEQDISNRGHDYQRELRRKKR